MTPYLDDTERARRLTVRINHLESKREGRKKAVASHRERDAMEAEQIKELKKRLSKIQQQIGVKE